MAKREISADKRRAVYTVRFSRRGIRWLLLPELTLVERVSEGHV
jgi:hypothetical protein